MAIKLTNNASTTVPLAVTSTQTSITVATGTGLEFPILGAGDYFYATIQDVNNNFEIVKVTARTDDAMTMVRAQEGTLAIPFAANSRFELRVTVENMLSTFTDLNFLLL
jgi:exosome complex RNA-binding protein Csl4